MNGMLWLVWAILLALAVSVTRNPFYLALALLAVLSVRIAVNTTRPLGRAAPRFAVLAALVLIGWSTVVNVLLAHVGDRVITRLPPWPVIGGPLTFNALLYGALTGIALATVLIGISLLHAVLDRHEALRLVPGRQRVLATTLAIALNALPTFAAAARDAEEAIRFRGLAQHSLVHLRMLINAVLVRGMDYSLAVAETLEVRGFAAASRPSHRTRLGTLVFLAGGLIAIGGSIAGSGAILALGLSGLVFGLAGAAIHAWPGVRALPWPWSARVTALLLGLVAAGFVWALRDPAADLAYSPYPTLHWPGFSPVVGAAYLLLAAPAFALRGGQE
ncbi:hypothetical protein HRbin28_00059 [bacterium HR28]|nr:hypothetical protein HRbin28_00059 [bacterium HR28]